MYCIGKQRLFYISKDSGLKTVDIEIINPSLVKSNKFSMTHLENDIYYVDITFRARGSYVFNIYENDILKSKKILRVTSGQHLFYPSQEDNII